MPSSQRIPTYADLPRPAIIAHRGSSAFAPENTLAAFKLAVEQGANAIELDTQLTSDSQIVVMHDLTLNRTTNGTGRVNQFSLSVLQGLNAGSHFDPSFSAEKVPSLADVFETVGGQILINVELKNYASPLDDLPKQAVGLVRKYSLEQSVIFSSFNPVALLRVHQLVPALPLGLLTIKGRKGAPLRSVLGRLIPHQALHPAWIDVTTGLVAKNHQHGYRVHPYVVNEPKVMQDLLTAGVDGFFTSDPPLALKVLDEIKERLPLTITPV